VVVKEFFVLFLAQHYIHMVSGGKEESCKSACPQDEKYNGEMESELILA